MDINRIRQMAREQGVDLEIQGLVCLPWSLKKYNGSIRRHQKKGGVAAYEVQIRHKDFSCYKSFNSEAEAEQYIRLTNVREGLLKNRSSVFANRVEVELTGGKKLICNVDNIDLIESHTWHCTNKGYAATIINGTTNLSFFHNLAMKHLPSEITVDHINKNGLDNRKSNLRLVDQRIQSINRGCQVNNNSSMTGVSYYKNPGAWVTKWNDTDGNKCCKWYSSKKYGNAEAKVLAIEHCQRMIWSLPHYREALCLDSKIKALHPVYFFFCFVDLVINAKLAIWAELQNGPLDNIDIDCHCGH